VLGTLIIASKAKVYNLIIKPDVPPDFVVEKTNEKFSPCRPDGFEFRDRLGKRLRQSHAGTDPKRLGKRLTLYSLNAEQGRETGLFAVWKTARRDILRSIGTPRLAARGRTTAGHAYGINPADAVI
jgi:hypothetical protein